MGKEERIRSTLCSNQKGGQRPSFKLFQSSMSRKMTWSFDSHWKWPNIWFLLAIVIILLHFSLCLVCTFVLPDFGFYINRVTLYILFCDLLFFIPIIILLIFIHVVGIGRVYVVHLPCVKYSFIKRHHNLFTLSTGHRHLDLFSFLLLLFFPITNKAVLNIPAYLYRWTYSRVFLGCRHKRVKML